MVATGYVSSNTLPHFFLFKRNGKVLQHTESEQSFNSAVLLCKTMWYSLIYREALVVYYCQMGFIQLSNLHIITTFASSTRLCAVWAVVPPLCKGVTPCYGWGLITVSCMYPVIMRSMSQTVSIFQILRERHFLFQLVILIFVFLSPKVHKCDPASLYKRNFQEISPWNPNHWVILRCILVLKSESHLNLEVQIVTA